MTFRVAASYLTIAITASLLGSCSKGSRTPKSVVLISLDTLRADRMSLYGAARQTTPAIDALAAKAVHFTNAFSPSPWTLPAHAAMLTGRYPSSLSSDGDGRLYRTAPLLSSILKNHGYHTAAVTGGAFVSKPFGADIGFDSFQVGEIDDAVRRIESRPGDPFFLFFHTYVTHTPYAERRYADTLEGGRLAGIYRGPGGQWVGQHLLLTCGGLSPTAREKEFLLALYDGGVAAADAMVAQLLSALRRARLLEQTIVIVTSDHGEEFWDHTGRGAYHGHSLYDELMRVPLVWYEPDLPNQGSLRPEPVSLIDLVPTLVVRLGFPLPTGVDGVDLSRLLEGRRWTVDRKLFGEAVRHGPPRLSVMSAAGKLILTLDPQVQLGEGRRCAVPVSAAEELYLPGDSGERHDRLSDYPQLAEQLAAVLRVRHAAAATTSDPQSRTPLDEATRERLRALGYTE